MNPTKQLIANLVKIEKFLSFMGSALGDFFQLIAVSEQITSSNPSIKFKKLSVIEGYRKCVYAP